ncbi:glycosyltransferase family 4 protein [Candidatus Woesearchaeota archaeon]|nr:glycosyltransferase family 4 protein [Candidatus Woesearchaeota archaeon]
MKIAYIFWGAKPHPRRELCAKEINADFFKIPLMKFHPFSSLAYSFVISLKLLFKNKYDVVLVDSGVALQSSFFVKLFSRKTKVIFYVLEPFFYNINKINPLIRMYYSLLIKNVDGYLTVSEMIKKEIKFYDNKPIKITMPFIWRNFDEFLKIKPNRNENFIYIKNLRKETNHQLLIDVFTEFLKKHPGSHLFIIGKGTKENISTSNKNIHVLGQVDPAEYLRKARFYIHPAFFDPGPISLLEAMLAGLVPLVTTGVGNHKIVEEIDNKLVINKINKETVLELMKYLINLDQQKFKNYSEKARRIAKRFSKEKGVDDFKNKFISLFDILQ